MKGHLYKKEQPEGWFVVYDIDGFTKAELPLHPEHVKYYFLDEDAEGGEVEFDWCVIVDHDTGKGKEYAKLIRSKNKIDMQKLETKLHQTLSEETDWTLSKWLKDKRDKQNQALDFLAKQAQELDMGYDKPIKKTGKMTEEEWQAAERAQTSKRTNMTAVKYLKENSDWFDKSPGGEKLYFESEVIRMMENYSSQTDENGKPLTYWGGVDFTNPNANLIKSNTSSQTEITWEGCDGCTEQDEVMYKNGYVKGYNAAIAELPKEISDEEILEESNRIHGVSSIAFEEGAKWYREQLKSRQ